MFGMSPKPSENGIDGDDERDEEEEDSEEEEAEEEEEDEPRLKYQRMGASVPSLLSADAATCIAVAERMIALGTHGGAVHILDFLGNQVISSSPEFNLSSTQTLICSRDTAETAEFISIVYVIYKITFPLILVSVIFKF